MRPAALVQQHLTIVANPVAHTARVEVPLASANRPFAVHVSPALTTDGWLVIGPMAQEAVWRASFASALDEAILQAARVLSERVHCEAGELAARVRARPTAHTR